MKDELDPRAGPAQDLGVEQLAFDDFELAVECRQVLQIPTLASRQIVDDPHARPTPEQRFREMTADEPRPTRDKRVHAPPSLPRANARSPLMGPPLSEPLRVLHIITGLPLGGAQSVLQRLASEHRSRRIASSVLALTSRMEAAAGLREYGIPCETLGFRTRPSDASRIAALVRRLRSERPHLVQTWLYHADLLGGIAARLSGRIPVVWNLRQSNLDPRGTKASTRFVVRACAALSRALPHAIVCGSNAALTTHAAAGYDRRKMIVIPNGFDVEVSRPDAGARAVVRREIGVPGEEPLLGLVARFDPQKDHRTFFRAVTAMRGFQPAPHFLLCGEGIERSNAALSAWVDETGLRDRIHLLGLRRDIPRLLAALDVLTSSSFGEGFPNAVGEAMACGVPCVVTDAGDSASLVGETGFVVPTEDPEALADAWKRILVLPAAERSARGEAARRRIVEHFSIEVMVDRYADLYRTLASDVRH